MNKVMVNVRGTKRVLHLGRSIGNNKWRARTYVNDNGFRTSVSGIYQKYSNGTNRFTPTGPNGDLL